jgi:dipeptidyl aminopeptidase/acylaminoacyl peptidase
MLRTASALYPVTDWAHYNDGYTARLLNGAPYDDEEAYRRSSPIYYADGYERGLQIQHGLVDNNVQTQDSFRLVQMLMEKKKPFDFMIYPVEPHGWRQESSRRDSYWRMTRWLNQELLGQAAVTGEAIVRRQ